MQLFYVFPLFEVTNLY